MDEDGNTIYYFVAEDPVPGFTPVYINNGTCGGSIVISNNCEPYELPETGSNGTRMFVMLGAAMIFLAAAVYIKSKFKMEVTK
jgi:LPXTG-motif cell wall-anchored protein